MKLYCYAMILVSMALVVPSHRAQQPKGEPFTVLERADLKQFEGVWVMKVETKKGWKGTIRATITLHEAGSKMEKFALLRYDFELARGKDSIKVENAGSGFAFAGVRQGKKLLLVTHERDGIGPTVPFKVEPKQELSAPTTITKDKLQLDFSKSVEAFCFPLSKYDLEWDQLKFTKGK
jgi:hypothetical protein